MYVCTATPMQGGEYLNADVLGAQLEIEGKG
jgi:hypothetical protein